MGRFTTWRLELQGLFILLFGRPRTMVFLLSAQRTGSTLLKALLAQADDVSHLPEMMVSDHGRLGFRLYRAACSQSNARILVIKGPAPFGRELQYGDIPWLWRRLGKFIVLYRGLGPFLRSVEGASNSASTNYRRFALHERLSHWLNTYRTVLERTFLRDPRRSHWVSYEELTQHPRQVTQELFRFIGSERREGVTEYGPADGVPWAWGFDDGGERIRSLKVHPSDVNPDLTGLVDAVREVEEARSLYATMTTCAAGNRARRVPDFVDVSWASSSSFFTQRTGRAGHALALFPFSIFEAAWQGDEASSSADLLAQALADAYRRRHGVELVFWRPHANGLPMTVLQAFDQLAFLLRRQPRKRFARECALYGQALTRALARHEFKVIFLYGPLAALAHLKCEWPMVAMSDAPIPYGGHASQRAALMHEDHVLLNAATRAAARRCRTVLLPSAACCQDLVDLCRGDVRAAQLDFAAGVPTSGWRAPTEADIRSRSRDRLRLLFVSSASEPRAGQVALQVHAELRRRGLASELTILGDDVPERSPQGDPDVTVTPLPVAARGWTDGLRHGLAQAHLLIAPERTASAQRAVRLAALFGVPSIAQACGADIPSTRQDATGWDVDGGIDAFVQRIEALWASPGELTDASVAALARGRLYTWESVAERLCDELQAASSSELEGPSA